MPFIWIPFLESDLSSVAIAVAIKNKIIAANVGVITHARHRTHFICTVTL